MANEEIAARPFVTIRTVVTHLTCEGIAELHLGHRLGVVVRRSHGRSDGVFAGGGANPSTEIGFRAGPILMTSRRLDRVNRAGPERALRSHGEPSPP